MQKEKLKTWFSAAAIAVALVILYFRVFERAPKFDERPHLALGEAVAEQAAKIAGTAGRITLIAPDTSVFENPSVDLQLRAFHRALQKANLSVGATNLIKHDPLRLPRVPPELVEMLRKQSEADVVVSWLGPLTPSVEQKARLPSKHARVVAICSGWMPRQINLKALFDDGLLDAAIISRAAPAPGLPQSDNLQQWFSHFFQVVTPKNISDLPSFSERAAR